MSSDEVKFAMEIIDETFEDPMWIDNDRMASLSMLTLTPLEYKYIEDHITEKIYYHNLAATTLMRSLMKSVKGVIKRD